MDANAFDSALIAAFFRLAAERGWSRTSVVAAARAAALPLDEARVRFPGRTTVLLRFGRMADQSALTETPADGPVRDRLFDLLMRRLDTLQAHRAGVLALLRALPAEPSTALLLACATRRSMRWMLEAAGVATHGLHGALRVRGLVAVWLWTLRAWERDESADLATTMAALDAALRRAEHAAAWVGGRGGSETASADTAADAAPPEALPESPPDGTAAVAATERPA